MTRHDNGKSTLNGLLVLFALSAAVVMYGWDSRGTSTGPAPEVATGKGATAMPIRIEPAAEAVSATEGADDAESVEAAGPESEPAAGLTNSPAMDPSTVISDLISAAVGDDDVLLERAIWAATKCTECQPALIDRLLDGSGSPAVREAIARALVLSSTNEGLLAVAQAAIDIEAGADPLRRRLLDLIAQDQSGAATTDLRELLLDADGSGRALDTEAQAALLAATSRALGSEVIDEFLSQHSDLTNRRALQTAATEFGAVDVAAHLAARTFQDGDWEQGNELVASLVRRSEPEVMAGLALLARSEALTVGDAAFRAAEWMRTAPDTSGERHDMVVGQHLIGFNAPSGERAIAAYSLAGSPDRERAIATLQKARGYEDDALVLSYINAALQQLGGS